jgi:hypothetical protein
MPTTQRPLSASEIVLARAVFGGSLNAGRVRIVHEEHPASMAARVIGRGHQFVVRGDRIFAPPSEKARCADYCAQGAEWSAVLAHELTHVWQYQHGLLSALRYVLSGDWRYAYTLIPKRHFVHYGFEQQASMVEDYVLLTNGKPARHGQGVTAAAIKSVLPFSRLEHDAIKSDRFDR